MVFGFVDVAQKDTKIQQSLVQALTYVHGVPADDMKTDPGTALLELVCGPGDLPHTVGLPGADVDVPADGIVGPHNLFLCPVHQLQNFLRPLSQQHPLLGEGDLPAAPDHQLLAQLLLQLPELSG